MSNVRFEPGKRVLLLSSSRQNPNTQHLVGTQQKLSVIIAEEFDYERNCPRWEIDGVLSLNGKSVVWSQKCMIIINPDETKEQSVEAMKLLHQLPKETV